MSNEAMRARLRAAVRNVYDIQGLRIGASNRSADRVGDQPPIELSEEDIQFHDAQAEGLEALEAVAFRRIEAIASGFPIYEWLVSHRGIGPAIAGVIISEFDPHRAPRPSSFWSYAGLGVTPASERQDGQIVQVRVGADGRRVAAGTVARVYDRSTWHGKLFEQAEDGEYALAVCGEAPRRVKGSALRYNSWLRSKLIAVLGGSLIKAGNVEYGRIRANRLRFRRNQRLLCMLCNGTGRASQPKIGQDGRVSAEAGRAKPCWNCVANDEDRKAEETYRRALEAYEQAKLENRRKKEPVRPERIYPLPLTPDKAPWGRGAAHRGADATRYMVKMFLLALWKEWRGLEGLPVVGSYHEDRLGHKHGT